MPNIPDDAVQAAAEAIMTAQNANDDEPERWEANHLSRIALEAAAPAMAEHAARAILAHRDAHGPADGASRRRWRRYLGVASQVVSFAFSTEEDKKRLAAQAIADGNYVACPEITGG